MVSALIYMIGSYFGVPAPWGFYILTVWLDFVIIDRVEEGQ